MLHHKIHHHLKRVHHHIRHHYHRYKTVKKHLFPSLSLILIGLIVIGTLILNISARFRQKAENTGCIRGITDISIKLNDSTNLANNSIINQNVFFCYLSINEGAYQADKHNICGIKINNAWPKNCPWDSSTTQIIENGVIKTRFTCALPANLQAGDKLQIVASRLVDECVQAIDWNESAQYVNGPLLFYQSTTPASTSSSSSSSPANPPPGGAGGAECPGSPSIPTNLRPNTTISTDGVITLQWDSANGALRYAIRIDDQGTNGEDGWNYGPNCQLNPPTHLTDICRADVFTNSYSYKVERGHKYAWWVHAVNTRDDSVCTKWSEAGTAVIVNNPYPSNTPVPTSTPVPTNTPTPTPTPTLTPTPVITLTPSPTPIGSKQLSIQMKLKFQGIAKKPINVANRMLVKVTFVTSDFTLESTPEFISNDIGLWSSQFTVTIPTQKNLLYKLLIKGPRHLQRKICVENPQDIVAGRYKCGGDGFRLNDINTFDFSGTYQYAGDVPPQSGVIDSYDFATAVRGDIGKNSSEALGRSDLNMDGFVDSQDYSLILNNLSMGIREDEK